MKNVYYYPNSKRTSSVVVNPYIEDLMFELSKNYRIINADYPSNSGMFQFFGFLRRTDYLVLNWIEDLPDKKFGRLQVLAFILQIYLLHAIGGKVVWILHNKLSHYPKHLEIKRRLQKLLARKSDYVITHCKEGLTYLESIEPRFRAKVLVVQHPVKDYPVIAEKNKEYDLLIWGSLLKYKGIDKFLEYLYKHQLDEKYRILVIGKTRNDDYAREIERFKNSNITVRNEFVDILKLRHFVALSKFTLFVYEDNSVLSSGALMDSIGFHSNIIGPQKGAFRDLAEVGVINAYEKFEDIISLLDANGMEDEQKTLEIILRFNKLNTWEKMGSVLHKFLNEQGSDKICHCHPLEK